MTESAQEYLLLLLSMTGFGEAHLQHDGMAVVVELRTINSRYFKLTVKCGEAYSPLEAEIEGVVRQHIKRGSVQVNLRVDRPKSADDYRINTAVLNTYRQQLELLYQKWALPSAVAIDQLLLLPGVVEEAVHVGREAAEDWPIVKSTLEAALANLDKMRSEEGRAMARDLSENCAGISAELAQIEQRAALVVSAYRGRLEDRVQKALAEFQITLDPSDVIKEVSIFAERSDISEEIVRLKSHLEQFATFLAEPESSGRKLDFLTQEMYRETNTIGSKANDVEISRRVIEIKAMIERIREMIQNVE